MNTDKSFYFFKSLSILKSLQISFPVNFKKIAF